MILAAASLQQIEQAEQTDVQARSDISLLVERNWRVLEQARRQFISMQPGVDVADEVLRLRKAGLREGTSTAMDLHAHEEEEALRPGREAVMLIEDDASVRQAVASFLCELGYDLSTASDPTQAIMLLRNGVKVDAIISDVKMPGQKTVLDLIAHVEAHGPVPIIFSTGYSDDIAIHEGQIAGRYPVLFKPFAIGALAAKLREVLQQPQPAHPDAASAAAAVQQR